MSTYNENINPTIQKLLEELKNNENVFICGPTYDSSKTKDGERKKKHKLRTYAHGGILCQIPFPFKNNAKIDLPSASYLKYTETEQIDNLDYIEVTKNSSSTGKKRIECKYTNLPPDNESRAKLLMGENLDKWIKIFKRRHSTKDDEQKERADQTRIARAHRDFRKRNTVICDFEYTMPTEQFVIGCKECADVPSDFPSKLKEFKQGSRIGKTPQPDLVSFTPKLDGKHIFTLIELKCNRSACKGGSGVREHAVDMLILTEGSSIKEKTIEELHRRFKAMLDASLFYHDNDPQIQPLLEKVEHDVRKISNDGKHWSDFFQLQRCFVFTGNDWTTSDSDEDAKKAIKTIIEEEFNTPKNNTAGNPYNEIPLDMTKYYYLYSKSPDGINLSEIKTWENF